MADLIDQYFQKHLNLPQEEAIRLHKEYYQTYGLAIEGLVRHHEIDPLAYNSQVDDALPLEGIIKPRPELKKLLEDIDRSKVRLWLFTNAYVNHAKRVVRLLGIEDKFDGVTYCDYSSVPFVCKPQKDAYVKAMKEAGVESWDDCYFVGELMSRQSKMTVVLSIADAYTQMTTTITASRPTSLDGMRLILWKMMLPFPRPKRQSIRSGIWRTSELHSRNFSRPIRENPAATKTKENREFAE